MKRLKAKCFPSKGSLFGSCLRNRKHFPRASHSKTAHCNRDLNIITLKSKMMVPEINQSLNQNHLSKGTRGSIEIISSLESARAALSNRNNNARYV